MPTVAAHNRIVTTDVENILDVRGSTTVEITVANNTVILRFAHRLNGVPGALGIEEFHTPKLLTVSDEDIDYVSIRSATPGLPDAERAVVTVLGFRG
jgi:hypothetical protein